MTMQPLRILYLGQKTVGLRCFDILLERQNENMRIAGAASNESSDVWWNNNEVYHRALAKGIPVVPNERRNSDRILTLIKNERVNCILAVQHPWILPNEIVQTVGGKAYNMHNAKLPDYKGHNACNHAILDGATRFTSTIHWLAEEVDAGAIIFEDTFNISPRDTARSLYDKAIEAGVRAFEQLLDALTAGRPLGGRAMNEGGRFYERSSIDALRQIKSPDDPDEVDRKARAFYFPPFEPAFYLLRGRKFYVLPEETVPTEANGPLEGSTKHSFNTLFAA